MPKKILLLIIILLLVAIGWYSFTWWLGKKDNATNPQNASSTVSGFFPTIGTIAQNISDNVGELINGVKTDNETGPEGELTGLLREIVRTPSPGFFIDGENNKLVYIDHQTGNLYTLSLTDLKQKPERISSLTITDVFSFTGAIKNKKLVAVLDKISPAEEHKKITIFKQDVSSPTLTESAELEAGAGASVVDPKTGAIYYTQNMSEESLIYKVTESGKTSLGTLPLSDWDLEISGNKLIATTYPDPSAMGYAYSFDLSSAKKEKVLVETSNLVLRVSPDYKKIIYSAGDEKTNVLRLINKHEFTNQTLGVNTSADKCVWSNDSETIYCAAPHQKATGQNLVARQRGEVSFSDYFVSIDSNTGNSQPLNNPSELGQNIDATNLVYADSINSIIFTNKKDLHTYLLGL